MIVEDRPTGSEAARRAMIDSQLRTNGINAEYVLQRMADVPREDFVPEAARSFAYIDRAIALGNGRFLPSPEVQGMMLQEARPTASDRAVLVDSGSGYLAELLGPLVGSLTVIGPAEALSDEGAGDFTLLIIDGAVEQLPTGLIARLTNDAKVVTGWLRDKVTCLAVGRKAAGDVALLPVGEIGIPILPEFTAPKGWCF